MELSNFKTTLNIAESLQKEIAKQNKKNFSVKVDVSEQSEQSYFMIYENKQKCIFLVLNFGGIGGGIEFKYVNIFNSNYVVLFANAFQEISKEFDIKSYEMPF